MKQCYSVGNVHDVEVENIKLNQMSFFIIGAGHAVFLSYFSLLISWNTADKYKDQNEQNKSAEFKVIN